MKPTFGRLSFDGAKHYSVHLDTIGLYGRSAQDLALLAQAFRLADAVDADIPAVRGLRIGLCETPMWDEADEDAKQALHTAAAMLSRAGAHVTPLVLSAPFAEMNQQQDVLMNEGGRAAFLPEYLRVGDLLHDDFRAKVENRRGFHATQMREVLDAVALRRIEFEQAFGDLDVVLTPSAPGEAPPGLQSQGMATFNRMWTALHVPCVSIPGLHGRTGLPIGMQLVHKRYEDARLLQVAAAVAAVLDPAGAGEM